MTRFPRTQKELKANHVRGKAAFKRFLVGQTGCTIQDGWPCGTCTISLFKDMGLKASAKEYKEHNPSVDRLNEVWRAILQLRGEA